MLAGCQANPIAVDRRDGRSSTGTPAPAVSFSPTATLASSPTPSPLPSLSATPAPTQAAAVQSTSLNPPPLATIDPAAVQESFEGPPSSWKVRIETHGGGAVHPSAEQKYAGGQSASLSASEPGSLAGIGAVDFNDPATARSWGERPGAWFWQRAMLYVPSSTLDHLGKDGYFALAGFWPGSGGPYGWWLRLRRDAAGNAAMSVLGYDLNKKPAEFPIYGNFPLDRWVDVSIGLHSQLGPGVKRSFAVLVDGSFYGWYHQGNMDSETYDHAAMGILDTNVTTPLALYIDQWAVPGKNLLPDGPDHRPSDALQTQDFQSLNGAQWQIDWATWANNLVLDPKHGLYSSTWRLQSGRNLDRMPDLTSGWAEIMIDWPKGPPPANADLSGAFAGLIGFHKEIAREQNLEVSPMMVNGAVRLVYDAWVGAENDLATWTLPKATTLADGRNLPEPGDILRVRWEKLDAARLHVQASYYDASTATWYPNVIDDTHDLSHIPSQDSSLPGAVNYLDGFHQASSITIDTQYYSIRRFTVGTLATYPAK